MKSFLLVLAALAAVVLPCRADAANPSVFSQGLGVNGPVFAILVQADGKVVIGGEFSTVNGIARRNVARLNADGTLDRTFVDRIQDGTNGPVFALAAHPSGGVLVGGSFAMAGEVQRENLALYNPDGKVDKVFGSSDGGQVTNGVVRAVLVQPDGKILIGGGFTVSFGQQRHNIARLKADGTLDDVSLTKPAVNGQVNALGALADGSFVAGGGFSLYGQVTQGLYRISQ